MKTNLTYYCCGNECKFYEGGCPFAKHVPPYLKHDKRYKECPYTMKPLNVKLKPCIYAENINDVKTCPQNCNKC
jgi:hypothetical protein